MEPHNTCTSERKSGRLFIEMLLTVLMSFAIFLFTALELSALQPWLVRPARESDCKENDGDSLVKRVVTRSDGGVRSACSFLFFVSFPFVSLHAVLLLRAFVARSAFDCWFELLLRQASVGSTAHCCGWWENNLAPLYFTFISGVVTRLLDCWGSVESEEDSNKLCKSSTGGRAGRSTSFLHLCHLFCLLSETCETVIVLLHATSMTLLAHSVFSSFL